MACVPLSVHQAILYLFALIAIPANSFLIFLVTHATNRNLGNYRVLLCTFAAVDIVISLYHAAVLPEFALKEYGYGVFAYNALHLPSYLGNALIESYILLFYQPFILLSFHFLYRLLSVIKRALREHFAAGIISAIAVNATFSMVLLADVWITLEIEDPTEQFFADVMLREYGVDMTASPQPNLVPVHYLHTEAFGGGPNWNAIVAMVNCGGVGAVTFVFNATCAWIIMKRLRGLNMSVATRNLHMQLLRALIVQFTVPIVLCVFPFFLIIGLPLTGGAFNLTGSIMGLLVSFFPVIDPICMILAYSRFRTALVNAILRIGIRGVPGDSTLMASSTVHPVQPIPN